MNVEKRDVTSIAPTHAFCIIIGHVGTRRTPPPHWFSPSAFVRFVRSFQGHCVTTTRCCVAGTDNKHTGGNGSGPKIAEIAPSDSSLLYFILTRWGPRDIKTVVVCSRICSAGILTILKSFPAFHFSLLCAFDTHMFHIAPP